MVDHVTQTFVHFAEGFGAGADIVSFVVYGPPDPAAQGILDGFGTTYMSPFEGFTTNDPA